MTALIEKIKVTNRIRKEITKIDELSADIKANGLLNPITVMSLGDGNYQLLAGLRRLEAVDMLGHDEIAINIVAANDAEAQLRIEISENESREPFTFSEKMDFARLLEDIEKEKAKKRQVEGAVAGGKLAGNGRAKESSLPPHGAEGKNKETREIVAEKVGMGKSSYDRAKYIADNAPDEVIEELDQGKRSIRGTYDELKSKEKTTKPSSDSAEAARNSEDLLTKAEQDAIQRNKEFNALSDSEKVMELQRQLKEERARAVTAESELARLKELRQNDNFHKDGIINNLQARLDEAETRVDELEALLGTDATA